MRYDAIVIGGGLSGLTAAALLCRRGLRTAVVEKSYNPGGSCGIFKRDGVVFDQGAAMLYGFGENGFNAHRFVFNCLEEPIDVIRHDLLYCVNFKGHRIRFWSDLDRFAEELAGVFPAEREAIRRFYRDMEKMYRHVLVERPTYATADETPPADGLRGLLRHPVSYARFLGFLNLSARDLLGRYFSDPEIFKFFNKLTSTYCYATLEEAPAVLAAVMFVDNHAGGSYYPAGSTLFLPGKLEKVIEENGGEMLLEREAVGILFEGERPSGVELRDGSRLYADAIIYSGTVWNLYGKLIDARHAPPGRIEWAARQAPTYPSVVLYAHVDRRAIPDGTAPIEMLADNPDALDESEVTVYIMSVDDHTLCPPDGHAVVAIGPTFEDWSGLNESTYAQRKEKEKARLIAALERRFPGFTPSVRFAEVATPRTIERYTLKNGGAVAGPKQMLGQHMFRRLRTRTGWENLFCCGESTVMGTGTPTVTVSGLSAANAALRLLGKRPYVHRPGMKNCVRIVEKPFTADRMYEGYPEQERAAMRAAMGCRFCERPSCAAGTGADVRGLMRRAAAGNWAGARKIAEGLRNADLTEFERRCVLSENGPPAAVSLVCRFALGR